jgi:hypothetical protein
MPNQQSSKCNSIELITQFTISLKMNITLQQAEAVIAAAKSNQKKLELKWTFA